MKLNLLNTGAINPTPSFGVQQLPGVKAKKSNADNRLDRGYGLDQWGDISLKMSEVANTLARRCKGYKPKFYSAFKSQALNDLSVAIRVVQTEHSMAKAMKSLAAYKIDKPVIMKDIKELFKAALKLTNR